ncbi:hypothetical protein ElyMa_005320200 [Elysia marginata]|uniref:Uncharacterized protein n=1 Tax=Elysia marginata TaxID=1093978 RepID=A0AAV4JZ06_9GAST|nr:hypothetical protein ElyMa_005320200 [Elysia marginata]
MVREKIWGAGGEDVCVEALASWRKSNIWIDVKALASWRKGNIWTHVKALASWRKGNIWTDVKALASWRKGTKKQRTAEGDMEEDGGEGPERKRSFLRNGSLDRPRWRALQPSQAPPQTICRM